MAEAKELIRSCLPEWRQLTVEGLELTAERVLVRVLQPESTDAQHAGFRGLLP
jgi:hypothetical protein